MTVDCLGMFSTAPPLPHTFTSLPAVANHKLAPTFPETKVSLKCERKSWKRSFLAHDHLTGSKLLMPFFPIPGRSTGPPVKPAVSSVRRTRSRFSFWGVHLRGLQELLWKDLQQPVGHPGVQEQLQVRRRQEEQDGLQGLQAEEVPHGRHVQVGLEVRQEVQLVQDPLPHAEPAVKSSLTCQQTAHTSASNHLCCPLNIMAPSSSKGAPSPLSSQ